MTPAMTPGTAEETRSAQTAQASQGWAVLDAANQANRLVDLQARWRWLARRWAFALLGLGVGLLVGWLLVLDTLGEYERAVQSLNNMKQQIASQTPPHALRQAVPPEALTRLPVVGQQMATWLALQQVLSMHQVRVLSLRPLDDRRTAALPNQAVAVRLQARFSDWAAAWSSLSQAGPVWSVERIRITSMAAGDAQEIDAVLRLWMREGTAASESATSWVSAATVTHAPGWDVAVFASPQKPQPLSQQGDASGDHPRPVSKSMSTQVDEPAAPLAEGPADLAGPAAAASPRAFVSAPERMPFAPWRLLGIWAHEGQNQAFLASDTHWFGARAGQVISQQGHHLLAVTSGQVVWRDPQGRLHTLTLESRAP